MMIVGDWLAFPAEANLMFRAPIEERYDASPYVFGIIVGQISINIGNIGNV